MKKCLQVKKPVSCVDFLAEEGLLDRFVEPLLMTEFLPFLPL